MIAVPRPWLGRAAALLAASAAVFGTRASFLAPTLGDIDSVNFSLALRDFDPVSHQPHAPGYAVYVAAARIVHAFVPDVVVALGLLSAAAQAFSVLPLVLIFQRLGSPRGVVVAASALTLTNPILWFNGARPMSDSFGLLLALWGQAMLLRSAESGRGFGMASFLVGLVPGARLQAGLLVLPLWAWAFRRRPGWRPVACLLAGIVVWVTAVLAASGGVVRYARAFGETMAPALSNEPVWSALTVNRVVKAAAHLTVGPWQSPALAVPVWALAVVGVVALWRVRPSSLGLAFLAFGPYLAYHAVMQRVEAYRYSLPYVPFVAWLAAEGLWWAATWFGPRLRWMPPAVTAAATASAAVVTLPALAAYHAAPSPPYAAMQAVDSHARPREAYMVAAHYVFNRYLHLRPPDLELIPSRPRRELRAVREYWLAGGRRTVLFVSEPRRTDLETVARQAKELLGTWSRPLPMRRFLSGERPNRAELVRITPPLWFAAEGWRLSLEQGRLRDLTEVATRRAYLSALDEPTFLLVAGEPVEQEASAYEMELSLQGHLLDRHRCGSPLLRGYLVPRAAPRGNYRELLAVTSRSGEPRGAPFALRGLDYGPVSRAGWVLADGWHYPATDEQARPFHWASPRARALVHVPPQGASLRLAGLAPLEYLGPAVTLRVDVDGRPVHRLQVVRREFAFEVPLPPGPAAFREVTLTSDRFFVPDRIQLNGDQRELAVRVYEVQMDDAAGG